jgi:hypothetical protein
MTHKVEFAGFHKHEPEKHVIVSLLARMPTLSRSPILIERCTPMAYADALDGLARVHHRCVEAGALLNFVLPVEHATVRAFWQRLVPGVDAGTDVVWVARDAAAGEVVGGVILHVPWMPNQAHRAEVGKLMVDPDHRGQCVA